MPLGGIRNDFLLCAPCDYNTLQVSLATGQPASSAPAVAADPAPVAAPSAGGGRKRIDVRDVFNQEDDDDLPSKRRKGTGFVFGH